MPVVTVQPREFEVKIEGQDLELTQGGGLSVRIPICTLVYPEGGISPPPVFAAEGLEDVTSLGLLRVVKTNGFENFSLQEANTNSNTSTLEINNKLFVDTEFINPGPSTFDPCNLDANGDGAITKKDVNRVYKNIPFIDSDYDINNDGIVDEQDRLLAQEYIGYFCGTPPLNDDDGIVLPPAATFKFSAKNYLDQSEEGWELGMPEDFNVYQHNEETFGNLNTYRTRVSATSGQFRDYIKYCFDNGYIDSIEDYYDPSLPVGSPFIDTETFKEPVFDFNSFRQYYRTNAYSNGVLCPVVRYEHNFDVKTRPIGRDFSVSFWWYWDSSLVPEGYTWQDVYANGYGGGGSSSDPTSDNFATAPAWLGTARYINESFYYGDDTVPPPETFTGNFNLGRTSSVHLWSISGLVQGYPVNEVFDFDAYTANEVTYVNEFYPDRMENRCMMRYDHQYSRLWFTGAIAGANTDSLSYDTSLLGSKTIDRNTFWEQDRWHNIVVTKEEGEVAKVYFDGEDLGTFSAAAPIGYYSGLRIGPQQDSNGNPVFRYEEDTVSQSIRHSEDVYFGGPAIYPSNYNKTYGHWRPDTEAYWSSSSPGQANHFGQGSGNFIGKTNAFRVWDQALSAEEATQVYNLFIASEKDAPT